MSVAEVPEDCVDVELACDTYNLAAYERAIFLLDSLFITVSTDENVEKVKLL